MALAMKQAAGLKAAVSRKNSVVCRAATKYDAELVETAVGL